ncbi:hypothetical protein Ga0074812_10419 [Parafrankia irregularis]|uniref:Uncharacterized protein n=1 Tax=Parafrankia irregularis TaxID=795642 RepID=A0A0S4QI87_9ACTN|nr:hypothetical protein Ga0074812_10419 [Parafrankia irregularis]
MLLQVQRSAAAPPACAAAPETIEPGGGQEMTSAVRQAQRVGLHEGLVLRTVKT